MFTTYSQKGGNSDFASLFVVVFFASTIEVERKRMRFEMQKKSRANSRMKKFQNLWSKLKLPSDIFCKHNCKMPSSDLNTRKNDGFLPPLVPRISFHF